MVGWVKLLLHRWVSLDLLDQEHRPLDAMISHKKQRYEMSPSLMQYLQHFGRRAEIPLVYDDLLRFTASMPYENPSGQET